MNEFLLIATLIILYACVLFWFKWFGKVGLICWLVFATICANIEVNLVVEAFGIKQTLGNILFASTFLVTDIISEIYGKGEAKKAVRVGVVTTFCFTLLVQLWLLYIPLRSDGISISFRNLFSPTLRILLAGLIVYVIVQFFDVYLYHKVWNFTARKIDKSRDLLWVRNLIATLSSQFFNVILFTLLAFWGVYESIIIVHIIVSSYLIFIVTSFASLIAIYIARKIAPEKE